jgi:molybdopterin converting factor small subunit
MQVKLVLSSHFRQMLGVKEIPLTLEPNATLDEAIRVFLEENPEYRVTLEDRKNFLLGELRAIYSIDGKAVKLDRQLRDGDEVNVLKAFIGG